MLNSLRRVSLRTRAILFVTLALLPLGLIGLWQTSVLMDEQRDAARRALLAVTERSAVRERQIIERAIGGAAALATTAHALDGNASLCHTVLARFVRSSTLYGFVAFHGADGQFDCASLPEGETPAESPGLAHLRESRIIGIFREEVGSATGAPSLVVATPVFQDADYRGHLQLNVTNGAFRPDADQVEGDRPLELVTFNAFGDLLTSEHGAEEARELLPGDLTLQQLAAAEPRVFDAASAAGAVRKYVAFPLIPGMVYALGIWPDNVAITRFGEGFGRTLLFTAAMWLASVVTVYLTMHFLVIKGLARLHGQMSDFVSLRRLPDGEIAARGELFEMERHFRDLAETVLLDEAELENSVREKNVLLKEVHHRVKNNLQLISSIINMVLRTGPSAETRRIVRRLQDRVMALASVHRMIYQAQSMDRLDAAPVVEEVVRQSMAIGLPEDRRNHVDLTLEETVLYPDQALPLTLLASEAVTNAIKHGGQADTPIRVSLTQQAGPGDNDSRIATLEVENDVAQDAVPEQGTALGNKLMKAFVIQLGGTMTSSEENGRYRLRVEFPVETFSYESEAARIVNPA